MPRLLLFAALLILLLALPISTASGETVLIWANKDNTLYRHNHGAFSNGAGHRIVVGRQYQAIYTRRGLVAFPVAESIPAGSTIRSVKLVLYNTRTDVLPIAARVQLFRVLEDWGEGNSRSYSTNEWLGAQAQPGDATWLHSFYDTRLWAYEGGNWIRGDESAELLIKQQGYCTWESTPKTVADVQLWLDHPDQNFGWLVHGPEYLRYSDLYFASREAGDRSIEPVIRVDFDRPVQVQPETWGYIKELWR